MIAWNNKNPNKHAIQKSSFWIEIEQETELTHYWRGMPFHGGCEKPESQGNLELKEFKILAEQFR